MINTVATAKSIQAGEIRMHYLEWVQESGPVQPSSAKPNMLLLHGLTSCAQTWSFVAPLLSSQFNVYALDLRGHGETDKLDAGYDFDTISEDVASFMETLGMQESVVAGHSWGASIAASLAASRPGLAFHLMMIDGGFLSPSRRTGMTIERWEAMLAPEEIYATVDTYLAAASHSLGGLTPELEDIFMASVYLNPDGSVREKLSRENQVRILRAMWDFRPEELYPKLACPATLIAARSSDPEMQPFVQRKEAGINEVLRILPQAQAVWMDDAVHDLQLQRPRELAQVMLGLLGD